MKKGFGSGSRSGSVQIMADPGGPKTYGSYRSGSTTLVERIRVSNPAPYPDSH
jgi:hypothetical protein